MAEAGVMGPLRALYNKMEDLELTVQGFPKQAMALAARLVRILVQSKTVAVRELERAICVADPVQSFGALRMLQVRQSRLYPGDRPHDSGTFL